MTGATLQNRYRLEAPLGQGAMGVVYRARDQLLDRAVAVKRIAPQLLNDAGRERFLREARSAARLGHPNIVTLHDAGEAEGGAFLVMELVEGRTLRELLPLPPPRVLDVASQLCLALEHAHARGIVHRDLKPENVVVLEAGSGATVKLMDFGLACIQDVSRLTSEGLVVGTLAYLAPEQALGEPIDGRADLYALGVVLYELCTGQTPFRGGSPQALLAQHLKAVPVAPHTLAAGIPPALDALILKLLAKRPDDRFPDAGAVRRALEAVAADPGAAAAWVVPAQVANAPPTPSELIGRDREIDAARERMFRDGVRLLTLTGPGGSGKTRLALRLAAETGARFPDGVTFVPLAPISDPTLVLATVARALGLAEEPGVPPDEQVRRALVSRRALLVLDNFEQVIAAAAEVARLLADCPDLHLMVTSRERLHLAGEHEFPVPPLALPAPGAPVSAAALAGCASVALFVRRARRVQAEFDVTDSNAAALARICTHLDGLPLAIELAAARIALLPPAALAEQLETLQGGAALNLLLGGPTDAPERQRTQRAAIAWSYELLDVTERAAFRRLSTFVGSFTLDGARALCGDLERDPLELVSSLAGKSMIQPHPGEEGEARFAMLETLREYGRAMLEESGEVEALSRRHFDVHLAYARAMEPELKGERQPMILARLERDLPNFRAALAWASGAGSLEEALQLAVALRWFWLMRGVSSEGRRWLQRARDAGAAVSPALRALALHVLGNLTQAQGDLEEAVRCFEESLALYREVGDTRGLTRDLGNLGVIALERGDYDRAERLLEEGRTLWVQLGDRAAEGDSFTNLSAVALCKGDYDRAAVLAEQGLAIQRSLGNQHHAAQNLEYLGTAAAHQGLFDRAEALYEESQAIRRALNDAQCTGSGLFHLGWLALLRDQPEVARSRFEHSLGFLERAGARSAMAGPLEGIAGVAAAGDPVLAARLMGAAEGIRLAAGSLARPIERARSESTLEALKAQLGERGLRAAWTEGRTQALDRVLADAGARPASYG